MKDLDFWRDGLRILCVRLDNLGDVLMTTPAFRALKTTWPHCQLTLLTSSAGAAIASYIPDIDDVIQFDVPWVSGDADGRSRLLPMVARLKPYAFDAAIIFTVQSQNPLPTALVCYLADIPRVLGYCRENPYQLMTDWVPDPEVLMATRHEVERQLNLVQTVGCQPAEQSLSLTVPLADRQYARNLLTVQGVDLDRPWLVLHPGVSEAKRRYPADDFAKALSQLRQKTGYQIVLTGSQSEQPLTARIEQQLRRHTDGEPIINLAGQLTIGQLIGLLAEAPLLIANNTGPVHIAAAVGTPVVVLYAKTNPQHTPWQVPSRVLYFDVPAALRSRNVLLQQFPESIPSTASPEAIVQAVDELEQALFSKNNVVCTH
ncbi:lipopolysaccharide heptosyltransferase II [Spirosoma jeollabukense]